MVAVSLKFEDREFTDYRIVEVTPCGDGWAFKMDSGWSFYVAKACGVVPQVGQTARLYGRGIGYTVRGLDIDGKECFYLTTDQQREKDADDHAERERKQRTDFESNRAKMDADYEALPEHFRRRIDKFRGNNPDFRWRFESYEMFCCQQAVLIAESLDPHAPDRTAANYRTLIDAAFESFRSMKFSEQRKRVPGLSDGHSGNTFGCAVALAHAYLLDPEVVVKAHGAMAPLVGSKEYGCVPR